MNQIKTKNVVWIDFLEPKTEAVKFLGKFNLHPLAIEEFSTPTFRPKALLYGQCLNLTIHIPLYDKENRRTFPSELDIVMTKKYLITGHDKDIFQLRQFFNKLKNNPTDRESYMKSPALLLYYIIDILLESCFPKIAHIEDNLNLIENEIFAGNEKEMVREISFVKRDILNFRRILKPQRSVLESLTNGKFPMIEKKIIPYFQDLIGTNERVWISLENAKETIESLEDTNDALLSNKLNLTMKVLTVFSAVMLPMTVISNILAMSAPIPFGNHEHGFWIWIAIMGIVSLITIGIFKHKKWF